MSIIIVAHALYFVPVSKSGSFYFNFYTIILKGRVLKAGYYTAAAAAAVSSTAACCMQLFPRSQNKAERPV